MTGEDRYICKQQRELYEYVCSQGADISDFSDRFMHSGFCNDSIDKPYSVDQFADIFNWLEFLEWEDITIEVSPEKRNSISPECAGWCGFTYRQIQRKTMMSSRDIAAAIPIEKLAFSYPGFHTIDEDLAADILIEDFFFQQIPDKIADEDREI